MAVGHLLPHQRKAEEGDAFDIQKSLPLGREIDCGLAGGEN